MGTFIVMVTIRTTLKETLTVGRKQGPNCSLMCHSTKVSENQLET